MITERLIIKQATDEEMINKINSESIPELKAAYTEMLDGARKHPDERQWYVLWFIRLRDTNETVGDICFKGLNGDGSVEIGYGTYEGHMSKGYMTEAVNAICTWAQAQKGVIRIEAEAEEENRASIRVLEKTGFIRNGVKGDEGIRFVRKRFAGEAEVTLTKASVEDFEKVTEFYRHAISINTSPAMIWIYGLHPSDEVIKKYIERGEMYYYTENGKIVSAIALMHGQNDDYYTINWQKDICDGDIITGHLLVVDPTEQNKGIAKKVVRASIHTVQAMNKRTFRLDTHLKNIPAQHVYASLGFTTCGTQDRLTPNAGLIHFYFYEYLL